MIKKINKPNLSNITQIWVRILMPFSSNYSSKISASELARLSKVPQQSASRHLNNLVKLNLIDYAKEGRNKLFYFDLRKQTTKIILNLIENYKSLQFQAESKSISVLVNEILNYCEGLIIFGSYASGKFDEKSDLDMVILGKCDKGHIKKIKRKQIIEINEHYITYNELGRLLSRRNPLSLEIMRNHTLFGDVSKIVDIFWRKEYERR